MAKDLEERADDVRALVAREESSLGRSITPIDAAVLVPDVLVLTYETVVGHLKQTRVAVSGGDASMSSIIKQEQT